MVADSLVLDLASRGISRRLAIETPLFLSLRERTATQSSSPEPGLKSVTPVPVGTNVPPPCTVRVTPSGSAVAAVPPPVKRFPGGTLQTTFIVAVAGFPPAGDNCTRISRTPAI